MSERRGAPVVGWGIDVDVDADGNMRTLTSDVLCDEDGNPVDPVAVPGVELSLHGGPFDGRFAEWHDYPCVFVALFGDDVASYVQARRLSAYAEAPDQEYVFIGTSKLWDPRRKLRVVR